MDKLRELIEGQPEKMTPITANAFIANLQTVYFEGYQELIAACEDAIADLDLLHMSSNPILHFEARAVKVLGEIESAITSEVVGYIKDEREDFEEDDECEVMDGYDPKTALNSLTCYK